MGIFEDEAWGSDAEAVEPSTLHNVLDGRSAANAHPMGAITGLTDALTAIDGRLDDIEENPGGTFDGVHNDLDGRGTADAHPASAVSFTQTTPSDWTTDPEQVQEALDELAARESGGTATAIAGAILVPESFWNPASAAQPAELPLPANTPILTYAAHVDSGSGYDNTTGVKRWVLAGVGEMATLTHTVGQAHYGDWLIAQSEMGSGEQPWVRVVQTADGSSYYGTPDGLNDRQTAAVSAAITSALTAALANYSPTSHDHDGTYSPVDHDHDATYAPLTTTGSTVSVTAASARTQIVGAADATSLLDSGSDTTLPSVNLVGTSVAASSKHLARWDCPAPPTPSHRLVGARVYGMAVDWGGWGETHVVATIFADGVDEALAEPSSLDPADNLASLGEVPHTIGGRGWYGQTPPAQFDLLLPAPVAGVSAGDYQFVAGIVGWDEGGPPVLALPDSVSIDDVVWLWDIAPIQLAADAGHSAATVSFAANIPGEVTLRLPSDVGDAFAVTCVGSDGYQNRVRVQTSAGAHLGYVWPGRTARFAKPVTGGTIQRVATGPTDPARYSTTAYRASVDGVGKDCARIIGTADDTAYEITAHLGNDGVLVFDNRAATVDHDLLLMGDYALSFGNEDNWPTDVTAIETVAAGELVGFVWSDAELRYVRLSVAGGGGGGGGASALDDLSDVTITSAATGDILRHNGTAWVDAAGIAGTDITSGTVPTARLGSGTASARTLLRGDQAWGGPNAVADLLGVDSGAPCVLDGTRQYQIPGRRPTGILTTITLVADRLYLVPVTFSRDWSVSALAFGVSGTVAETTARIGLWAATSGWQGSGAPLIESGDISTATAGYKTYTPGSAVTGNAGNYLLGVCATGAITLRGALMPAADIAESVMTAGTNTAAILQTLRRLTHTGGTAMPSSPTWDTVTATSAPYELLLAAQWSPQ